MYNPTDPTVILKLGRPSACNVHMLNTELLDDRVTDSADLNMILTHWTHSCLLSGSCRTEPQRADKHKCPLHFLFSNQETQRCMSQLSGTET